MVIIEPRYRESTRPVNPFKTYREKPAKSKGLAPVGKRGKRLAKGDVEAREECHELACLCGCGGESEWAHLIRRGYEDTRHEEWNSIPLCRLAHRWLDSTAEGAQAKEVLVSMARAKGERLTHAEFWPVMDNAGGYGWTATQRARGLF